MTFRPLVPITLSGIKYFDLIDSLTANGFFEMGKDIPTSASNSFASSSINLMFSSGESLIPRPKLMIALQLSKSTSAFYNLAIEYSYFEIHFL